MRFSSIHLSMNDSCLKFIGLARTAIKCLDQFGISSGVAALLVFHFLQKCRITGYPTTDAPHRWDLNFAAPHGNIRNTLTILEDWTRLIRTIFSAADIRDERDAKRFPRKAAWTETRCILAKPKNCPKKQDHFIQGWSRHFGPFVKEDWLMKEVIQNDEEKEPRDHL